MSVPQRINIKFFIEDRSQFDAEQTVNMFHEWIQNSVINDVLLIDVADYKHVPNGPGVMLIGHEVDYSFDEVDGRLGFFYSRKRWMPETLEAALQLSLAQAVAGLHILAADERTQYAPSLDGVEVTFADRLNTPNSDEGFDAVSGAVADVFAAAYGSPVIVERSENDPRLALRVKVTATTLPALAELSVSVPA